MPPNVRSWNEVVSNSLDMGYIFLAIVLDKLCGTPCVVLQCWQLISLLCQSAVFFLETSTRFTAELLELTALL